MASFLSPDVNLVHFILRLLMAIGSLFSFVFKMPFIIWSVQFVIEFTSNLSKGSGSSGGLPSGGGGSGDDGSSSGQSQISFVEIGINVAVLVILLFTVMAILERVVWLVAFNRPLNIYSYLVIMGCWIMVVLVAIMVQSWSGPLNYAIFLSRLILVGWFAIPAPSTWHFVLLRSSIIIDILCYPAMIGVAFLQSRHKSLNDEKVGVWTRYNNLIRTL